MESIWNNLPSFLHHLFDPESPKSPIPDTPTIPSTTQSPIPDTPTIPVTIQSPTSPTSPTSDTPPSTTQSLTPTPMSHTYNDIRDLMIR